MYLPAWTMIILLWIISLIVVHISTKSQGDYDIVSGLVRLFGYITLTLLAALIIAIIY